MAVDIISRSNRSEIVLNIQLPEAEHTRQYIISAKATVQRGSEEPLIFDTTLDTDKNNATIELGEYGTVSGYYKASLTVTWNDGAWAASKNIHTFEIAK